MQLTKMVVLPYYLLSTSWVLVLPMLDLSGQYLKFDPERISRYAQGV